MIQEITQKKIKTIWDDYVVSGKLVKDTDGSIIYEIDKTRESAIRDIEKIIDAFTKGKTTVFEFKTVLDSYNKRNNLWGFTATKGQMFFNQLVKTSEQSIDKLTTLLKQVIVEPKDLNDALDKISALEKFANDIFKNATDKRKAPNPGSVCYFLSYFWQIHNPAKWPIFYTSLINAFTDINIWKDHPTRREDYEFFYNLNEEIKGILKVHSKMEITNWDAEHAFWNLKDQAVSFTKSTPVLSKIVSPTIKLTGTFDISKYILPAISSLVELGDETQKAGSAKGAPYEKMVGEAFKLLGFDIETLGQGSGNNPDIIIKFPKEHTAFIVDAKAYNDGYTVGTGDNRAIRDYINTHCPKFREKGITKVGFIIVSNSFKTDEKDFINEMTWNTDIKRFILLTSEALQYYSAFKFKDGNRIDLPAIIDHMINADGIITKEKVVERFDNV